MGAPDLPAYPFTLALDDADTPWGGCTTHATFLLLQRVKDLLLVDYPLLVRLAPGVPRKTRGNAATVLRGYSRAPPEELASTAYELLLEYSPRRPPGKRPGVAVVDTVAPWRRPPLRSLYLEAVRGYVARERALEAARRGGAIIAGGSGAVGASAALAALAPWDEYTFELIAYRSRDRCVEPDPAWEARVPTTCWGNYDQRSGAPVAAPHGPDPVLAGFRGSDPRCLAAYAGALCSEASGWIIFRSNQHTGVHLRDPHRRPIPYGAHVAPMRVSSPPRVLPGGHVILDAPGAPAAFYRETGRLARAARMLRPGDEVRVGGVASPRGGGLTLAAEELVITRVNQEYVTVAPRCPRCGARMESAGRGKGYRCPKCGYRDPSARPLRLWVPRRLAPGRITSSPGRARHLTRIPEASTSRGPPLGEPLPAWCFLSTGSEPPRVATGNCR